MPPHGTLYGATHRNQGEHDMTQTNWLEVVEIATGTYYNIEF